MFIVQIESVDSSYHTQLVDAEFQKQIFISNGVDESNIAIVEKDTFEPVEN